MPNFIFILCCLCKLAVHIVAAGTNPPGEKNWFFDVLSLERFHL